MTRTAAAGAIALAVALGAAFLAVQVPAGRARHLGLPVLSDPSLPAAPGAAAGLPGLPCRIEEVGRIGRRVTALLPAAGGSVWVGTFDDGVARLGGQVPAAARSLAGRRRMVNALAIEGGSVWAATQGGLVAVDGPAAGQVLLEDESVSALGRAGAMLLAGTGHGLYRLAGGAAEPLAVTGPDGESLRVTALAVGEGPESGRGAARLWIGTSSGVYAIGLDDLSAGRTAAAWHPLVFGDPPAASNVVTALVALGEAAVAGTDDGGLARLGEGGEVSAIRFTDPLANQVNPGAASGAGATAALGTQGGGLLLARAVAGRLEVTRAAGLETAAISAAVDAGDAWLVGTAEGVVLRVEPVARVAARAP